MKGHTAHDPAAYRPAAEVDEKRPFEPMKRAREALLLAGVAGKELDGAEAEARAEIGAAVEASRKMSWPEEALAWQDVQDARWA